MRGIRINLRPHILSQVNKNDSSNHRIALLTQLRILYMDKYYI